MNKTEKIEKKLNWNDRIFCIITAYKNWFFFRKLRDEYDKLEGALRKLGVDPENVIVDQNVVGRNVVGQNNLDDFEDEENLFDDDDYSDYEEETHEVIQMQRCHVAK